MSGTTAGVCHNTKAEHRSFLTLSLQLHAFVPLGVDGSWHGNGFMRPRFAVNPQPQGYVGGVCTVERGAEV